ncbi:unnamed protein product [Dovyalis caffra]|uniref:GAT domain-containing protein n=1 Tax=Dovyalis caffra TaxID=77055 RepID=A0AAV1RTV1_9ROSI|nr:unnamed protein product [Dovyalis caffra]
MKEESHDDDASFASCFGLGRDGAVVGFVEKSISEVEQQDDLTTTLVQQCRQSQTSVQRIIETAGDNEALLFEALNVNDEIQKVLSKYEELKTPSVVPAVPEPAMIPVSVEPDSPIHAKEDALIRKPAGSRGGTHGGSNDDMMDDLDEMIFGKKGGAASEGVHDPKQQHSSKDDLITF